MQYISNYGRFRICGLGDGGLYFSTSKIKPAPLPEAKKIQAPLPEAKKIQAPLHDFTIEK